MAYHMEVYTQLMHSLCIGSLGSIVVKWALERMPLTCSLICFHDDAHPAPKTFWVIDHMCKDKPRENMQNMSVSVIPFMCTLDRINKRIVNIHRKYSLHMTSKQRTNFSLFYQLIRHLEKHP